MDSKRYAIKALFISLPAWLAGITILLLSYGNARADFHDNEINEFMAGLNGDTTVQFVEIHMLASVQNCQGTGHHPTANESPDDTNPPCSTTGTGARLLFFNAAGTQTAEFIFPHNTARGDFDGK